MDELLPNLLALHSYLLAFGFFTKRVSQKALSLIWTSSGVIRTMGPGKHRQAGSFKSCSDWPTIFCVKIVDMESELPIQDNLVISFVPFAQCRKLRAWKLGKRTQAEPVYGERDEISPKARHGRCNERHG